MRRILQMVSRVHPALTLVVLLTGAAPVVAQPAASGSAWRAASRPGVGALLGGSFTGDVNVIDDAAGLDLSVNGDIPLTTRWRLRAEFGRARWSFDGNTLQPEPLPPEGISLTRVSVSAICQLDSSVGWYVGGGAGIYRYAAELTPLPRRTRPGGHIIGGSEIPLGSSGLAMRFEGHVRAVGGPNEAGDGRLVPSGPAGPRSRVASSVLLSFGVGAGIGWRF
jgi:hypothetical protein